MLWFITSLRFNKSEKTIDKDKFREEFRFEKNTVGFFSSREEAIYAIENNWGDLNEAGWYPWLVVEGLPANCVYPLLRKGEDQFFFEWQGKDEGKWVPCDFPKEVEDFCDRHHCMKQFCEIG